MHASNQDILAKDSNHSQSPPQAALRHLDNNIFIILIINILIILIINFLHLILIINHSRSRSSCVIYSLMIKNLYPPRIYCTHWFSSQKPSRPVTQTWAIESSGKQSSSTYSICVIQNIGWL